MKILSMLCAVAISLVVGAVAVPILKRAKTTQTVLHYVCEHSEKNGTPTMGGIIFILSMLISTWIFCRERLVWISLAIASGSGFVGLLDDYAKVKFGKNLGLKPYQKIISQLVLSIFFSYYIYSNVGSEISIPFVSRQVDIGLWSLPLLSIFFIATTNTVNLTDGLDGLAGTSIITAIALLWLLVEVQMQTKTHNVLSYREVENFATLFGIAIFSVLGFLAYNTNKASVFMGDVGSLFLGGVVACTFAITKNMLYLIFLGLPFVLSGASDILQVCYFKLSGGKRIFLMAPYHHHLQRKGLSEGKICVIYQIATALAGLSCIAFLK